MSKKKPKISKQEISKISEALASLASAEFAPEQIDKKDLAPQSATGKCVVCKGIINGEYLMTSNTPIELIPIGPGSNKYYSWQFQGYHCSDCGLQYKFLPPEGKC